jgi:hypothetical protein
MDYYRIWNELRVRQGQLYVLEIKERSGEITDKQVQDKIRLESEISHWYKIEDHWNKYGEDGFDDDGSMKQL